MPEFIINTPTRQRSHTPHAYYGLCEMAQGYVEAMFFTNGDTGDDNENLLNDLGVERLTRSAVKEIKSRVDSFNSLIMPDGCFARQWVDRLVQGEPGRHGDGVQDATRAGHRLWYATQGHGVSWSDDYSSNQPEDAIAQGLQEASQKLGEAYVEVLRGWIYIR